MLGQSTGFSSQGDASRKALPKRKGNSVGSPHPDQSGRSLNESPYERVEKSLARQSGGGNRSLLVESPYENLEKWSAEAEDLKGASEPQ